MAQLTKHKRFQRSFELSEGDVWFPKLFRHTVPQHWPGGPAVAKQQSPNCLHDLLTKHARLSADRRGRRPAAVTSVHLSQMYLGLVAAKNMAIIFALTTCPAPTVTDV